MLVKVSFGKTQIFIRGTVEEVSEIFLNAVRNGSAALVKQAQTVRIMNLSQVETLSLERVDMPCEPDDYPSVEDLTII